MPADPTYEPGRPRSRSRVARRGAPARARARVVAPPAPAPVQRSARTQTPAQRTASAQRARQVIRHGGRVVKPSKRVAPGPLDEVLATEESRQPTGLGPGQRAVAGIGGAPSVGGVRGFVGNLGADVAGAVTGVPSLAQLLGHNVAAFSPFSPGPYARVAHALGVPGTGWAERLGRSAQEVDVATGKGLAADYATRWVQPGKELLLHGDVGPLAHQLYKHPGLAASDVAGLYSAAGAATRIGAVGVGRAAGASRIGQAAARIGSKSALTHARPPKERTVLVGPNTKLGAKGAGVARVEIAQRPYSVTNPFTRGAQKLATRVGQRLERRIIRKSEGLPTPRQARRGVEPLPSPRYERLRQARYDFVARRQGRDMRLRAEGTVAQGLRTSPQVRDYVEKVHALDDAGSARLSRGQAARWSKEQVDQALDLHARDLLRVPGKTPRQALNEVIAFRRAGLDELVKGGGIKTKGALEELETLASLPDELLDLSGGAAELRPAVEAYRSLARSATERRVAAGTLSEEAAAEVPSRAARQVHGTLRYDPKTKSGVEPPRIAGAGTTLPDAVRSPLDPYAGVGAEAVYVKDIPAIRMGRGATRQVEGQYGRLTQDKDYASHGVLFRGGITQADRGLPLKALERALADELHPGFVEDVYKTFAFRRPNGKYVRNKRATALMEADPDSVVLLSEKALKDAISRNRDLPEGELPDSPFDGVDIFEGTREISQAKAYLANAKGNKLIAFPKSAVDGIREGWQRTLGPKGKGARGFDSVQQLWKRGILAFAPRWYLNSLIGNTFMYGVATGGDVRSIMQAVRLNRRRADALGPDYEARVRGSTNVAEARLSDPAAMRGSAAGNKYRRITDRLMGKQASFDALFRQALYINRMKKGIRREGGSTRGLSVEDLADAFRQAPKQVQDGALRDVELFLGDYMRIAPWERATLRRIFPFYSWMRVIGRFMLEVPIRHPKRTAILASLSRAAAEVENPLDPGQNILANRGRVIAGGLAARTAGANPLFTNVDLLTSITGQDLQGGLAAASSNLSPVGLQQLARNFSGTTAFGAPVSFPPGYQGAVSSFGMDPQRISPTTGQPEYFNPTIPLEEQLLQTIPLAPGLLRGLASGGRQPYDVTTTRALIQNALGGGGEELFEPERGRAMSPIPGVSPLLSLTGIPLQRYNRAEDLKAIKKRGQKQREAERQTKRRRRKATK